MAAEVAYYTYMYAKVEKEKYQVVTGQARASLLSGRFIASVLAQVLYSTGLMNFRELNYISLGGNENSFIFKRLISPFDLQLNWFHWLSRYVFLQLESAYTCGALKLQIQLKKVLQSIQQRFPETRDTNRLKTLRNQNFLGKERSKCFGIILFKHIPIRLF